MNKEKFKKKLNYFLFLFLLHYLITFNNKYENNNY